jgi:hypothetical protein
MAIRKIVLIVWLIVMYTTPAHSQTIDEPNIALKSHETLDILKIEITSKTTLIWLSVENRRDQGGSFCADKNIYLTYPDGSRQKLTRANNIPVCPDNHIFKSIGEKLQFTLEFPPIKPGTKWIDLIEECADYCFSFYGVCLDNDLNKKIDDASRLAENNEPAKAMLSFIKIAEIIESKNSGIEGLIYINIIKLAKETGNITKAAEWYSKLKMSGISRCEAYIKHINSQGIIY